MQLPIATVSSDDVMRAARRCRMDLSRAVADEFAADGLFAFASANLPALPAANCVELNGPLVAGQFDRIVADFAERNCRCLRWTSPAIDSALVERGATTNEIAVMRLVNWSRASTATDTMILQARAAVLKIEQLFAIRFGGDTASISAGLSRVDDPQDEWLIAIENGKAVASAAVLTSGETGLVHDVFALPGTEQAGRELMDRVLDFAARAGLRHVVGCVQNAERPAYLTAGFVDAGKLVEHFLK